MVATRHCGKDCTFHFYPSVDHLVVAETEDDEVDGAQLCVTGSIKFKTDRVGVIGSTIDFKNETPANQEVDSFPIDPHLPPQWQPESGESYPRYGLGTAFADPVSQMEKACVARDGVDKSLPI